MTYSGGLSPELVVPTARRSSLGPKLWSNCFLAARERAVTVRNGPLRREPIFTTEAASLVGTTVPEARLDARPSWAPLFTIALQLAKLAYDPARTQARSPRRHRPQPRCGPPELCVYPAGGFPAVETHIMEHGLYMLEGQGLYLLGDDWHEIWADDFIWMGSFCPQQFYPTGYGRAVYLLYKDVNREVAL